MRLRRPRARSDRGCGRSLGARPKMTLRAASGELDARIEREILAMPKANTAN